jgi:hypothetical protein
MDSPIAGRRSRNDDIQSLKIASGDHHDREVQRTGQASPVS